MEEWNKRLEEWGKNEERNLWNPVGDYDSQDNHEPEEENAWVMLKMEITWDIPNTN